MRWEVVARALSGSLLGIVLTDQFRDYIRKNHWLADRPGRLVRRMALAVGFLAAVMFVAALPFLYRIIPPDRTGPLFVVLVGHVATLSVWSGIYLAFHYLMGLRSAEADRLQLTVATREAELAALRSQLNPHFLFNSLNSLRSLVTEDPVRARKAVTGLSALLRYALGSSRDRTVSLHRELEATRHYLELEAIRLESRLNLQFDIDPRALDHPVPPMLVQTLAENAVKHGIARLPRGGRVRIEARRGAEELQVRVMNTGTLNPAGNDPGIGISNALERLRLLFGERANLSLVAAGPGEVCCEVVIPTLPDWRATVAGPVEAA
jgi:hypothetical protein